MPSDRGLRAPNRHRIVGAAALTAALATGLLSVEDPVEATTLAHPPPLAEYFGQCYPAKVIESYTPTQRRILFERMQSERSRTARSEYPLRSTLLVPAKRWLEARIETAHEFWSEATRRLAAESR